jgi:hypothetical protein
MNSWIPWWKTSVDHDQTEAPICPPVTEDNSKITYERCISFPVDGTFITRVDQTPSGTIAISYALKKTPEKTGQP